MTTITDLAEGLLSPLSSTVDNPTLGHLRVWLAQHPGLDKVTRQKLMSGIKTVARVLDVPLNTTSASPAFLAEAIRIAKPAFHGVTKPHWANVRSSLVEALDLAGLSSIGGRRDTPLKPDWAVLWETLQAQPELQRGLIYLMRYCSALGISPGQVGPDVVKDLLADMMANVRIKYPRQNHRRTCKLWNKARMTVPGWPQVEVEVPRYCKTYSPAWDEYPESLRAALDDYITSRRKPKLTAKKGKKQKPIDESTARQIEGWVRRFAGALVQMGVAAADLETLADLVKPERYELGLQFFIDRNDGQTSAQISNIAQAMKVIAEQHVQLQGPAMAEIAQLRARVREERSGLTEKNKQRLVILLHPENRRRLLDLPHRLAALARNEAQTPFQRALHMQMAVAIRILLFCPMRIGNLAALDLKQHITTIKPGAPDGRYIFIPKANVKNNVPIDCSVPPDAASLIDEYVKDHRHLLAGPASTALFPGEGGKAKGSQVLGKRISATILEHTGLDVNPHLFRHFAAWCYLRAHPGNYESVRQILGHRNIQTTIQFYCDLENRAAFERLDAIQTGDMED